MLSGGQKHHFLPDSVLISKFCAVYQILRNIPRAQNRRILEGLTVVYSIIFFWQALWCTILSFCGRHYGVQYYLFLAGTIVYNIIICGRHYGVQCYLFLAGTIVYYIIFCDRHYGVHHIQVSLLTSLGWTF